MSDNVRRFTVKHAAQYAADHPMGEHRFVHVADYDAIAARVAELKSAVLKYGWHDDTCNFLLEAIDCDCGLEALRLQCADSAVQK